MGLLPYFYTGLEPDKAVTFLMQVLMGLARCTYRNHVRCFLGVEGVVKLLV